MFRYSLFVLLSVFTISTQPALASKRPAYVQQKIDNAFNDISTPRFRSIGWIYSGACHYHNANIDDDELASNIINNGTRKEYFFMDIGSGQSAAWGEHITSFLDRNLPADLKDKIHITCISLNGEIDDKQMIEKKVSQNITHIMLRGFKVENLTEGLEAALGKLPQFDLIVSRMTFNKLADAMGTWIQAYNLLSTGGYFSFDRLKFAANHDLKKEFETNLNFLTLVGEPFIFALSPGIYSTRLGQPSFCLRKLREESYDLPWAYQEIQKKKSTIYEIPTKLKTVKEDKMDLEFFPLQTCYGNSKDFFDHLQASKLFTQCHGELMFVEIDTCLE